MARLGTLGQSVPIRTHIVQQLCHHSLPHKQCSGEEVPRGKGNGCGHCNSSTSSRRSIVRDAHCHDNVVQFGRCGTSGAAGVDAGCRTWGRCRRVSGRWVGTQNGVIDRIFFKERDVHQEHVFAARFGQRRVKGLEAMQEEEQQVSEFDNRRMAAAQRVV